MEYPPEPPRIRKAVFENITLTSQIDNELMKVDRLLYG